MKHELDLRKKAEPRIIERIVFQRRPWHMEALKLTLAILVATGAVYGISRADEMSSLVSRENPTKSFSAIGFVSGIVDGIVSLERAQGSDGRKDASYSFGLATVSKIETSEYVAIPASLLRVGDQIIVQGTETDGIVTPIRIVSFAQISAEDIAAASLVTPSEGVTAEAAVVFASTAPDAVVMEESSTSTEAVSTSTVVSVEPVSTSTDASVVSNDSAAPVAPAASEVTDPAPVQSDASTPVATTETQAVEPVTESAPAPVE